MAVLTDEETHEETPLLNGHNTNGVESDAPAKKPAGLFSPLARMLMASFLVATSFCFTQVPILFIFKKMVCEDFYSHNPPWKGPSDECSREEIDGGIAAQTAILGFSTTLCGTINLFVAGWMIKRWGPKAALFIQAVLPASRVFIQTIGALVGGRAGIIIFQTSQLMTIIGGPAGYLLVLNTAVGELVSPEKRTGAFGQLQGAGMLGTAIGFLVGSIIGDIWDVILPFKVAFCSFLLSCVFIVFFTPYIDPASLSDGTSKAKGVSGFFEPLKVLGPHKMRLGAGNPFKSWGITFLALGVFLGVLATSYAPFLIQIYAMTRFHFRPADNGYLMALNFLTRGFFLMVVFPAIITAGRKWFARSEAGKKKAVQSRGEGIPTHPEDFDPIVGTLPEQEPAEQPKPVDEESGREFDLFFLRWSLVLDGTITALAGLVTSGWQIYLIGGLLPFASGSAPAAKGVITEMCPPSRRPDALQAMTLVESTGTMATLAIFGAAFSAFSEMGRANLTFFCNAGTAVIAVAVLLLSRFPPTGATHDIADADEPSAPAESNDLSASSEPVHPVDANSGDSEP